MAGSHFFGLGTFLQTFWHAFFTSGSEGTAFGEIDGAGDISLQDDPLFLVAGDPESERRREEPGCKDASEPDKAFPWEQSPQRSRGT